MMERYKGYWITGSAVPGPPYTHYWHPFGTILKDGRMGSVVEVVRFQDTGSTTTCPGSPSFTGWNLVECSLTIVFESRQEYKSLNRKRITQALTVHSSNPSAAGFDYLVPPLSRWRALALLELFLLRLDLRLVRLCKRP